MEEENVVSYKVPIPRDILEDTSLDQVYNPLLNLLVIYLEEEVEEVIIP